MSAYGACLQWFCGICTLYLIVFRYFCEYTKDPCREPQRNIKHNPLKHLKWLLLFLIESFFLLSTFSYPFRDADKLYLWRKLVGSVAPNPCWPILFHFPLLHFIWGYFHTWEFNWGCLPQEFDVFSRVWKMCCRLEKQSRVHLKIVVEGWLGANWRHVPRGPQKMWKHKHTWGWKMYNTVLFCVVGMAESACVQVPIFNF